MDLFLLFCEATLDVEGQEAPLLLVTPFVITVSLFLVTQVRFWSLAPLQQLSSKDMGQKLLSHSQISAGLRNDFLPLQWEKLTGTFKAPQRYTNLDKCHCNTECSENLNF